MLNEVERELITAAVDGELPADRQTEFRRLVAESAAAHALYQHLSRDRSRLRELPRTPAPTRLLPGVLARTAESPRPSVPARPGTPARGPVWVPIGLAASVMLIVGGGSFLYFQSQTTASRVADQNHALPKPAPAPDVAPAPDREQSPQPRLVPESLAMAPPALLSAVEVAPAPRTAGGGDVITAPVGPDAHAFSAVQVRVPVLLPLAEFANEDVRRQAAAELARDPGFRIDLFANDPHRAADALVAAGRAVNLTVSLDATAQDRLRKRLPFVWVVAADVLTPAEVADWLAAAHAEAALGSPAVKLTADVHLVPAGAVEQKEWRELLGTEAPWGKPTRTEAPPAAKPITDDTANRVTNALQKPGPTSRPERHALLLTYHPKELRVNSAFSREVKQFTERRTDRKPGTVPVMIVIRPANP